MVVHTKTWMTSFLFKEFLSFFKKLVLGGIFPNNYHLLALDGHGSHVSLKTIEQAQQFGLNMITLPSHASHVLQPLDVSCFKPFQITFKKKETIIQLETIIMSQTRLHLQVGYIRHWIQFCPKETSKIGFRLQEFGFLIQRLWMEKLSPMNFTPLITTTTH